MNIVMSFQTHTKFYMFSFNYYFMFYATEKIIQFFFLSSIAQRNLYVLLYDIFSLDSLSTEAVMVLHAYRRTFPFRNHILKGFSLWFSKEIKRIMLVLKIKLHHEIRIQQIKPKYTEESECQLCVKLMSNWCKKH